MEIPFNEKEKAIIAYNSLKIDKEPSRAAVTKVLSVRENFLIVKFSTQELRKLKPAITSFLDYLMLVSNTIEKFSLPLE